MKCPHCSKPISFRVTGQRGDHVLTITISKAGEFPVEGHDPQEAKQTYLPLKDLEPKLEEYSKYIELTPGEGVLFVRIEGYIHDNNVWSAINKIIKAHGGKYIKGGDKPGHWEVPT